MKTISVSAPNKPKRPIKPVKLDGNKVIIGKGDSRKPVWWRVTLGKKITGTTKKRKFFKTEAEANEFIDNMLEGKEAKGSTAFVIPNALAVIGGRKVRQWAVQ